MVKLDATLPISVAIFGKIGIRFAFRTEQLEILEDYDDYPTEEIVTLA